MVANAPGPRGVPVLGSLLDVARDPLDFLTRTSRTWGDVVRYRIGRQWVYLVSHPDAVQQLLVETRELHKDQVTSSLGRLLGRGLLTAEDDLWKRQRKLAAPSFQPRHLAAYATAMVESTQERTAGWTEGIRDVHDDFTAITLEIVLRTLFGSSVGAGREVGEALGAFMGAFEEELRSWRRLLPESVPTAGRRRVAEARATIRSQLDLVIAARRSDGGGDDLLSRLIAARDEDGGAMSDEQLRDEAVTLFLAGHETTALTLSYSAYLLAAHPEIQERARAEVDQVLGGRPATVADLPRLKLVDAILKESMRLYPPAFLIGRTPLVDLTVMGFTIPKGAQILVPQWVVHRDPRWWRDADAFLPDRWLDGSAAAAPRFAFFPFGGGPRVCIGNHFAQMEAALSLATTLQSVTLAADPSFELELMPAVTLRPRTGVRLRVTPRKAERSTAERDRNPPAIEVATA